MIDQVTDAAESRLEDMPAVLMAVTAFQSGDITRRHIEGVPLVRHAQLK
jgi:hypothetical protein